MDGLTGGHPDPAGAARTAAGRAARESRGRLLALLSGTVHDLTAAEDALADAFEQALRTWPDRGVPDNPDGWLLTVARNRLRDWWKSAATRRNVPLDPERDAPAYLQETAVDTIPDRRLELMLLCAHPAIDSTMHTPLMLDTVLGFTAAQIAGAFAVPTATMATRLVRAKKRIKVAGIPFRLPGRDELPGRMAAVLEAVYGAHVIDRAGDAQHLAEILAALVPGDPEVHGLAALVQLSRARAGPGDRFVPLAEQDTALWDRALIGRAHEHLRAAHACGQLGRFQIEAAIQAVHCARTTDWKTLLELHLILQSLAPSLGGAVALAAVVAEVDGPAAGLDRLDGLRDVAADRFQPAMVLRAHLLERLGRTTEAVNAYDSAVILTRDPRERAYLEQRRVWTATPRNG